MDSFRRAPCDKDRAVSIQCGPCRLISLLTLRHWWWPELYNIWTGVGVCGWTKLVVLYFNSDTVVCSSSRNLIFNAVEGMDVGKLVREGPVCFSSCCMRPK